MISIHPNMILLIRIDKGNVLYMAIAKTLHKLYTNLVVTVI